jgi:hypothetical protein
MAATRATRKRHDVHDVVEKPSGVARVEQREDVKMVEPGGDLNLAEEAPGAERGRALGTQDLQGHGTMVLEVAGEIKPWPFPPGRAHSIV